MRAFSGLLLLSLLCPFFAQAQSPEKLQGFKIDTVQQAPDGRKRNLVVIPDNPSSHEQEASQVSRVIVKLGEAVSERSGARLPGIDVLHQQFRNDLKRITQGGASGRSSPNATIIHEYTRVFNGFAPCATCSDDRPHCNRYIR